LRKNSRLSRVYGNSILATTELESLVPRLFLEHSFKTQHCNSLTYEETKLFLLVLLLLSSHLSDHFYDLNRT
jgi:hypothetical protein